MRWTTTNQLKRCRSTRRSFRASWTSVYEKALGQAERWIELRPVLGLGSCGEVGLGAFFLIPKRARFWAPVKATR